MKTNSKRAAGSESREGEQKAGAIHPEAKLWLDRGSEVWQPNGNRGCTHANLGPSPALQLHSCHPWVFPLKSCWITLSNLLPAAGTGRTEHSTWASDLVQGHTPLLSNRIWALQIQKLEHGKTNGLWADSKCMACAVSQNVLFGKLMLRTAVACQCQIICPVPWASGEKGWLKMRWRMRIELGWLLYWI